MCLSLDNERGQLVLEVSIHVFYPKCQNIFSHQNVCSVLGTNNFEKYL